MSFSGLLGGLTNIASTILNYQTSQQQLSLAKESLAETQKQNEWERNKYETALANQQAGFDTLANAFSSSSSDSTSSTSADSTSASTSASTDSTSSDTSGVTGSALSSSTLDSSTSASTDSSATASADSSASGGSSLPTQRD